MTAIQMVTNDGTQYSSELDNPGTGTPVIISVIMGIRKYFLYQETLNHVLYKEIAVPLFVTVDPK